MTLVTWDLPILSWTSLWTFWIYDLISLSISYTPNGDVWFRSRNQIRLNIIICQKRGQISAPWWHAQRWWSSRKKKKYSSFKSKMLKQKHNSRYILLYCFFNFLKNKSSFVVNGNSVATTVLLPLTAVGVLSQRGQRKHQELWASPVSVFGPFGQDFFPLQHSIHFATAKYKDYPGSCCRCPQK